MNLPKPILVLSDGTGETAEKVVRAGLKQFEGHLVHVRVFADITEPAQLRKAFETAARTEACVFSTLVNQQMRVLAGQLAGNIGVPYLDLIDNLLGTLQNYLETEPVGVPGLLRKTDETYFKRIAAVEYTVKADDGKEPRMLTEADLILVGVSRTSKTPLSTYLAHKGFKVGNVPIVLDHPLPNTLFSVDERRIFALTIQPTALQGIRRSRLKAMGMHQTVNYDDLDYILAELEYAEDLYRGQPEWPIIDVTSRAVEETAATIIGHLHHRGLIGPDTPTAL